MVKPLPGPPVPLLLNRVEGGGACLRYKSLVHCINSIWSIVGVALSFLRQDGGSVTVM